MKFVELGDGLVARCACDWYSTDRLAMSWRFKSVNLGVGTKEFGGTWSWILSALEISSNLLSFQVTNLPIFKTATNALAGELSNATPPKKY